MPQVYDSSSAPKKPKVRPVRVFTTPRAKAKGLQTQRSVREINAAVGSRVIAPTKRRGKADIIVKPEQRPKAKYGKKYAGGTASRIPRNRADIESGKTVVRVTPARAKTVNVAKNAEPGTSRASLKSQRRKIKGYGKKNVGYPSTLTHELGHALGLPDRYAVKGDPTKRKFRKNPNYNSVMGYGTKLTGYDVRKIKRTVGLKSKKVNKRIPRRKGY